MGISNRRLLELDRAAGTVTFDYKDYADGARHKRMRLEWDEFLRRLCLHFLPPRFVKIRHYGLLTNRGRQERLERARALLAAQLPAGEVMPVMPSMPLPDEPRGWPVCPHCGWPALILVRVVRPGRWKDPPTAADSS